MRAGVRASECARVHVWVWGGGRLWLTASVQEYSVSFSSSLASEIACTQRTQPPSHCDGDTTIIATALPAPSRRCHQCNATRCVCRAVQPHTAGVPPSFQVCLPHPQFWQLFQWETRNGVKGVAIIDKTVNLLTFPLHHY